MKCLKLITNILLMIMKRKKDLIFKELQEDLAGFTSKNYGK
jgi:hypothetical protein